MPRASIIIVNWNGKSHLTTCLDSLAGQTFRDFEVILVDNGSRDGSVEYARARYPHVRLVPLSENTGFATGNNRGLEQARGEYIITLNNDTLAESDWLENLVKVADAYPRAGMVGSRICSFTDPDVLDSLGMGICRDGMSRGRFRNRRWSSFQLRDVEDILFPSACAALYRKAMLRETGFFDDDFFAYAEDADLGLRGRLAGWEAVLATRAVVYHKYSQTGGEFSPFKVYLVERNHYWVVMKTFPLSHLLALPIFTVLRCYEQFRGILKGQGAGGKFLASGSRSLIIGALLRGMYGGITNLPRMLGKRRQIMRQRKISMGELVKSLRLHRLSFRELLGHG